MPVILAGLLVCAVSLPSPTMAQRGADASSVSLQPAPYQAGEKLTYIISFSDFNSAAHAEITVGGHGLFLGRDGIELLAHVETLGVVNAALYALDQDYRSYVDPGTGRPFHAEQMPHEALPASDGARDYSVPAGASALRGASPQPIVAFDLLSAFYRARSLPLLPGASYTMSVQLQNAVIPIELKVTGTQLVKTNLGSFNSIVTQVKVPGDSRLSDYRVRMYFSDDVRHTPLLITCHLPSGDVRAEIASSDLPASPPPSQVVTAPNLALNQAAAPDPAPRPVGSIATAPPSLLSVGEQLNFSFFLGGAVVPAGTVSYQVRARTTYFGRTGFMLTSKIQTAAPQSFAFPVQDEFTSYVDPTTLLPYHTELKTREGRHHLGLTANLDQNRGVASFSDGSRVDVPLGTYDLVSVLYALRSFDLAPGKNVSVSILINKISHTLSIHAVGRAAIELQGKHIQATELSLAIDGPRGNEFNLHLWISNDRRRLPLRLTATTPLGPVRGDLAIIPVNFQ